MHDVVLFLDSDKKKQYGVILEICEKNQVMIRSVLYGSVTTRKFHIRVLTLLYRPQEWEGDFPVEWENAQTCEKGLIFVMQAKLEVLCCNLT